jgi:hypothetical protein
MSLHVLAYNLKRTMRIFGVKPLMAAPDPATAAWGAPHLNNTRNLP